MRRHILFSLFEDDYFETNQQIYLQTTLQSSVSTNSTSITNVSSNILTDGQLTFNNFHEYLNSSYSIIYLIILSITCFEILVANILLIYTVFSNKLFSNKLTTNHVVMSLAISDLLIGLLIMPYYIFVVRLFAQTNKKSWHYEVWLNLDSALTTASIYSLMLVTLDRYLAVTRPIQYTRNISNRKVKLCIVLIWIISLFTTFLSSILMCILNFIIEDDNERAISRQRIEQNIYFHIFVAILTFYIPFFIISYTNVATYLTIKRRLTDKKLKIRKIENSRSSQRILVNYDSRQSDSSQSNNTTITSQQLNSSGNLSNNSSNSNSKLCLNCFNDQNYVTTISGCQIVDYNNNDQANFQKKLNKRRCSLCSCHLNRNFKKESITQFNTSYHFSIANTFTWKSIHRTFIEKLHQKHKEGLTKNYTFVFKEYKLIKLLLTVNCCFTICWLPIYLYQELVRFNIVQVDNHLLNYLLYLGWLNSGLDPCIYLNQSKKIRKEIKQKFFCCLK